MQYPIAVIHLYPDRNIITINNVSNKMKSV